MAGRPVTRVPEHVRKNRRFWDGHSAEYQREHAPQLNRWDRPVWGIWAIPEDVLGALGDVGGQDVLEFGCGGAQWSIALARRGAHAVGLDLSIEQLRHAWTLMRPAAVRFPVVNGDGEAMPFGDERFDLVFCDHGAMTFGHPFRTVPEAARVLRPGGRFVFNIASVFHSICWNDDLDRVDDRLHRGYFGVRKWDEESVDFQLPYGEWIRLFHANGLEVEDLVELRPPPGARTTYADFVPLDWARRWPAENIWKLRKHP
ncbi:MAG TPA: class I SAM-dependent methyltransferase [Actinomycetota bacterium]|nr:class I SAM-dependent methyltransferase [Actinomycetota bacterium]